jgi:hypothetical protein
MAERTRRSQQLCEQIMFTLAEALLASAAGAPCQLMIL